MRSVPLTHVRSDRQRLEVGGSGGARYALATLACALVAAVAAPAHADKSGVRPEVGYNYGDIETPRLAATNGATRALSSSTEALFDNPANMSASRVYHLSALAQIWPESRRQSYGAAAVDSVGSSARVAGGIGATTTRRTPTASIASGPTFASRCRTRSPISCTSASAGVTCGSRKTVRVRSATARLPAACRASTSSPALPWMRARPSSRPTAWRSRSWA